MQRRSEEVARIYVYTAHTIMYTLIKWKLEKIASFSTFVWIESFVDKYVYILLYTEQIAYYYACVRNYRVTLISPVSLLVALVQTHQNIVSSPPK